MLVCSRKGISARFTLKKKAVFILTPATDRIGSTQLLDTQKISQMYCNKMNFSNSPAAVLA